MTRFRTSNSTAEEPATRSPSDKPFVFPYETAPSRREELPERREGESPQVPPVRIDIDETKLPPATEEE